MTAMTGLPVITADCRGCGACLLTCPEHAIRPAPLLIVLDHLCNRCGECVEVCPAAAIEEVTP
jgi:ferredoxin